MARAPSEGDMTPSVSRRSNSVKNLVFIGVFQLAGMDADFVCFGVLIYDMK